MSHNRSALDSVGQSCTVSLHTIPSFAPPSEVPRDWRHHKYSAELHVQRHVRHSWLASSPADADLIVVATNLSLWCAAGRPFGARALLKRVLADPLVRDASQPKAIVLTNTECAHVVLQGLQLPRHVLLITDRPERPLLVAASASSSGAAVATTTTTTTTTTSDDDDDDMADDRMDDRRPCNTAHTHEQRVSHVFATTNGGAFH